VYVNYKLKDMEEKKLDINSIIGFLLIGAILLYMLWQNQPTPEQLAEQEKAKQEQLATESANQAAAEMAITDNSNNNQLPTDSQGLASMKNQIGDFAYALTLPSATTNVTTFENEVLALKIDNKGGFISEVRLKSYVNHDSVPVYLIKDGSSVFNLNFATSDNRTLNSTNLYFQPTLSTSGDNQVLSMRLKVSETQFLEYRYELKPNDYMLGFSVKSQGLSNVLNTSQDVQLDWKFKAHRQDQSISFENRYTRLTYQHEGDKINKLSQGGDDDDTESDVAWLSFRQHFFSTILVPDTAFKTVDLKSFDLVQDETIDTLFTKRYEVSLPLSYSGGELAHNMNIYYGPTYDDILNKYDRNLEASIPFGWGIFGWINKAIFSPLYAWLTNYLPYGLAIIVMTIMVKILLSFVQYKQFLSQAKMRILKPELDAIREKYKNNKMKAQQETLAVQNKAGASPLSGCLPGMLQMPVFYALFMFFPIAFELRQKSFLWVDDLSSYDSIAELPFNVPFYGDHISLFPILASIAIFFYMKMTTGQQMATQPTQEGMPDMGKMMKYMIYLSPVIMLVFFNNYASGLSLYYFISNLISIGIMLVIKNYIIDEDKVLAKIQVSKAKPKKQNRFQKKMAEIMEQAEAQKAAQQKRKK
jgi:YidC/Oxa1 family membrane protein insertase|tara:strand:- start:70464 stop:72392 length:1929 start_codon:yes stop_codon:yes gene_type:complete